MRSAARLTYTQATRRSVEGKPEAREKLGPLCRASSRYWWTSTGCSSRRARGRGALDFDAPRRSSSSTRASACGASTLRARNEAHKLIEECMILANVAVATRTGAYARARPCTACTPSRTRRSSSSCARRCASLGIEAQIPETVTPRDLQAITRRSRSAAERAFIESLVVRSMPQALYQPTNIGHFGLALDPLRPLHLPDPPLSGSGGAPHAQGAGRRRRRAAVSSTRSDALSVLGESCRAWRSAPTSRTATSRTSSSARICESASARPSAA